MHYKAKVTHVSPSDSAVNVIVEHRAVTLDECLDFAKYVSLSATVLDVTIAVDYSVQPSSSNPDAYKYGGGVKGMF